MDSHRNGVWMASATATLVAVLAAVASTSGGCGGAGKSDVRIGDDDGKGGAGTDGGDAGGAGGEGGGGECGPGATLCGGVCTVTAFDPEHCGVCDHACKAGEVCSQGQCGPTCNGGTTECGGVCVNTASDPAHCGACGAACAAGEVCQAGKCALTCSGSATKCGAECKDLAWDPANCGACGNVCPAGQVCSSGVCDVLCSGGTTKCGALCVDLSNDPQHCGDCATVCPGGDVCSGGKCSSTCGAGLTLCAGQCVNTAVDPSNCGQCGKACPAGQLCSNSTCDVVCFGGLVECSGQCVDTQTNPAHCGGCGQPCPSGETCSGGACQACDSATVDCDADGWLVAEGDCCDKPGFCGAEPAKVNPGAVEVVGNGVDDNCNGKTDLFDAEDTVSCDAGLASNSQDPLDYARAIGVCRTTQENPPTKKERTWGLLDAKILRADGSPLGDYSALSIRGAFGSLSPGKLEGDQAIVLAAGTAADATQTDPGPNNGAPAGFNVSNTHNPTSSVSIGSGGFAHSVKDWYAAANPPLKPANGLPDSPGCNGDNSAMANDSVMLVLRLRAPTNARAFSFNSYFLSAEYPEWVCTNFNDQFIALVDTPAGTPSPIPNPVDKNLMTYTKDNQKWPIGINVAKGTDLFAVCDSEQANPSCWDPDVSATSCSLGSSQLAGTGFEAPAGDSCLVGGGTYWLTTAGNVIPGEVVELRIAIWDVGDSAYDSYAVIDGFQWLSSATLPGTGN